MFDQLDNNFRIPLRPRHTLRRKKNEIKIFAFFGLPWQPFTKNAIQVLATCSSPVKKYHQRPLVLFVIIRRQIKQVIDRYSGIIGIAILLNDVLSANLPSRPRAIKPWLYNRP